MSYGVAEIDMFQTVDLYERKAIATVTQTIERLGAAVSRTASLEVVVICGLIL